MAIQLHGTPTYTATIPRPTGTKQGYRACPRCGITFPLNSRSHATRQTHCRDCRSFVRRDA